MILMSFSRGVAVSGSKTLSVMLDHLGVVHLLVGGTSPGQAGSVLDDLAVAVDHNVGFADVRDVLCAKAGGGEADDLAHSGNLLSVARRPAGAGLLSSCC